jgi:hypothetical protein
MSHAPSSRVVLPQVLGGDPISLGPGAAVAALVLHVRVSQDIAIVSAPHGAMAQGAVPLRVEQRVIGAGGGRPVGDPIGVLLAADRILGGGRTVTHIGG